jgi:hypothetical protein
VESEEDCLEFYDPAGDKKAKALEM